MLPLLLLLMTAQVPAVPGETTLVSFCKRLRASACQELRRVNPKLADAIEAEALKAAQQLAAQRAAEEESSGTEDAKAAEADEEASSEDSDCQGQNHHAISKPIARVLARHATLAGLYEPRDERFKTQAKDKASHCGYQKWHRDVDKEVIEWLRKEAKATPEQFEKYLREIYNRPEMRKRFPNGL
ncbi:MAG TPA: Wall-associated protein precursor [Myxococcaceae bacterium]|jgi:hypothetical protein